MKKQNAAWLALQATLTSIRSAVKNGLMSAKAAKAAMIAALIAFMTQSGMSQTDITGVINAVDGYLTAAIVVGVAVLLFTLGRAIVRKVAR